MDTEKKYYFDIKWFVILAIVAFLVIFQVLPLLYLIYRSFFADGSFSLLFFHTGDFQKCQTGTKKSSKSVE